MCGLPKSHGRTSLTCLGERRPSAPWPWSLLSITTNPHPSMLWTRLMLPWISKMSPLLLITLRYDYFKWNSWLKTDFPPFYRRIKHSHLIYTLYYLTYWMMTTCYYWSDTSCIVTWKIESLLIKCVLVFSGKDKERPVYHHLAKEQHVWVGWPTGGDLQDGQLYQVSDRQP